MHHRHVRRHDRQAAQKLAHLLPKVANVADVSQLARARDGVHLDERVHQGQHHFLVI